VDQAGTAGRRNELPRWSAWDASGDGRPTFVVLDTFELAIIHSANANPEMVSRPNALVVSDDLGNVRHPGDLVDLAEQDETGNFKRTIIKTGDPDRYGIRVGDYFL